MAVQPVSNDLLRKKGIKYAHSPMHRDYAPYYVRVGEPWTKTDITEQPQD